MNGVPKKLAAQAPSLRRMALPGSVHRSAKVKTNPSRPQGTGRRLLRRLARAGPLLAVSTQWIALQRIG